MTSFSLAVSTLQDLLDPKNPEALCQLGGVGFVAKQLRVDVKTGLTKEDLNRENLSARVNHFGRNVLPEPPSKGFFQLVWEGLQDNTLIMLCISAIISLVLGIRENPSTGWIEGVAIIMAVVIVVLVSAVNDYNKEVQFRKLNAKKNAKDIKVFRDGKQKQVPIDEILVGDIVDIATGDILAADGLFLDGHDIRCDESGATGESDAIKKGPVGTADPFFLSGTQVMEGSGRMMVIAVGEASYNGKTMMSLQVEPQPTPLQEKLEVLAEQIAYVGIVSAGLTFAVLTAKNLYLSGGVVDADFFSAIVRYIITAITMLVVAVPEGLPLAVTMALAYSTTRMLEDNNLVRHLDACETMGGATNICSDKTGTLTENKMTVVEGQVGGRLFDTVDATTGEGWHKSVRNLLLDGIAVNSNAYITTDETGKPLMVGSKTETALLQFGTKLGGDYNALRAELPAVHVYPFSSASKSMSTVVKTRTGDGGPFRFFVKGASEIVLGRCSKYIGVDGVVHDMDENKRESLNNHINDMATDALRTIGLAYADLAAIPADNWDTAPSVPLVLVSLVGIRDPVRKEVPDAVRVCQRAGVKVRMVTGDNLVTARNIAEKCGIYNGGLTMEGPAFRKLPPAELNRIVPQLEVLARSSPTDKQILVRTLIANGEVVAVTGDGTNDGPALKLAHVGFAMGVTGTDVAKEASDIILMDDNFTSIVKAVSWGRNVFSSIRKFLQFQLTVNVAAVVLAFVGSVTSDHGESPLKPVQLLWVNLIMDTLAALALATEDPVPEMLLQKPYGKKESLISPIMWKNIVGQAIYQMIVNFAILYQSERLLGIEEGSVKHLTMFFNTFVMCQLFNEVNSRKINGELNVFAGILKNWLFVVVMLFTLVGQWAIIEYGGDWVGCTPLTNDEWLICIGLGALSIPVSILIRLLPFARATAGSASEDTPVILDKIATVKSRWQKAVKQVQTQRSVVGLFRRSTKSRLQRGYSRDQK